MRLRRVSYRFNFRIDPNIPSHDPEINAERSLLCTFIRFTKIIDHISPFVKRFYKKPYQKFLSGHNLIVEASLSAIDFPASIYPTGAYGIYQTPKRTLHIVKRWYFMVLGMIIGVVVGANLSLVIFALLTASKKKTN